MWDIGIQLYAVPSPPSTSSLTLRSRSQIYRHFIINETSISCQSVIRKHSSFKYKKFGGSVSIPSLLTPRLMPWGGAGGQNIEHPHTPAILSSFFFCFKCILVFWQDNSSGKRQLLLARLYKSTDRAIAVTTASASQNVQIFGLSFYTPNFEEVDGAYWFKLSVRASMWPFVTLFDECHILWTVHARVLKFHIWTPHGKIADPYFFSCPSSPSLELCPFEKIRMKSDACHILRTLHARVLKFHPWIPHGKKLTHIFFLSELPPFLELCPFEKIGMKSCQQDISKTIWARGLKLQLIGDDE